MSERERERERKLTERERRPEKERGRDFELWSARERKSGVRRSCRRWSVAYGGSSAVVSWIFAVVGDLISLFLPFPRS
jgi:hypothetical protein